MPLSVQGVSATLKVEGVKVMWSRNAGGAVALHGFGVPALRAIAKIAPLAIPIARG